jgi:hypothetical protein
MGGERTRPRGQPVIGFPHADVEIAGSSDFMFDIEPLEASVPRAKAMAAPKGPPVVLLDRTLQEPRLASGSSKAPDIQPD